MDESNGMSRRAFLRSTAQAAALGAFAGTGLLGLDIAKPRPASAQSVDPPLVWVWKFSVDGPLGPIRDTLGSHGLGIIFKTHNGTDWMERHDDSPDAVTGPSQVNHLRNVFEDSGIPFHAWCVVEGRDPVREAQMCAEVLDAGARSIFLDLEPNDGGNYWQGTSHDALTFGNELRRLKPDGRVVLAPDVRPWQAPAVPLAEFMSFSDAVAPQSYWVTFSGPRNAQYLRDHGYSPTTDGFTPELVVDVALGTFQQFGRPIHPIGQGAASPDDWRRFVAAAESRGMQPLSVWRYGTADPGAFGVLHEAVQRMTPPPPPEPEAEAEILVEPQRPSLEVEPIEFGESLSDIPQLKDGYPPERKGLDTPEILQDARALEPRSRLGEMIEGLLGQ